jgi:ribosomal 50S subunit-recycling heat shock protein
MRLDKFLKVSRIIKRRTLAKEICDQGRVDLNGRTAKASASVTPGDHLLLTFGTKRVLAEVLLLAEHAKKDQAADMYRILSEERINGNPSWDDDPEETD